ncbi:hypothetical protein NEHOM01_1392 [Nematocida homosporus]|uniref:uncharacterized protein n=1 Tax=Nematocida homosporus TaxID=1912981 RepID=UPI00221FB910|nr:uncharacterized protein NEHOM01_1392 [Nematocida homosporus]KAI5186328.1 hypothetical protein NEHOM01_1392 [Nematocida homosporus]
MAKQVKKRPLRRHKRVFKHIKSFVLLPFTTLSRFLKKRKAKRELAKRNKSNQTSDAETVQPSSKKVTFSPTVHVHLFYVKAPKTPLISLKKLGSSFVLRPDEASLGKERKKKDPLLDKVLAGLQKKQTLADLRALVFQQEKPSKPTLLERQRPQSKILSILDGYSEASVSDTPARAMAESAFSETEPTEDRSHSEITEHSSGTQASHSSEELEESVNESNDSQLSSKSTPPYQARKSEKKKSTKKPDKHSKPQPTRKNATKNKRTFSRMKKYAESLDDLSSVSSKIYDILKKHGSEASSPT